MNDRQGSWSRKRGDGPRVRPGMVGLVLTMALLAPSAQAVVLDSFLEDFEARTADVTIDGQELWKVTTGATLSAIVQSGVTPNGTGKSLKLTGASSPVGVTRSAAYGGLRPTWVRFLVRPGLGGEQRPNPTAGIAAVSFDFSGKILAADGTSWVDTGQTYTPDTWWEVTYKLSFTNHAYDLYLSPVGTPRLSFIPVKTGLRFIDGSKNSLSTVQLGGAFGATQSDDSYVDDMTVTYIERIEFISAAQTLIQDQPSGPVTVQLQNSLREPQRTVTDIFLELKSTSPGGKFSLQQEPWADISQVLLPKDATSVTVYYKDTKVGRPILSVQEFPDQGWLEGLQEQKVTSKQIDFEVLATSPQTAAQPFSVTIYARNKDGLVDESYSGTIMLTPVYVSPASGTMVLSPIEASGFVKGKLEVQVMYPDAGSIMITVTDKDNPTQTGTSGQLIVLPASFQVQAQTRQIVGRSFPLSIIALNAAGAVTPNYQGAVNLMIQAISPTTGIGALTPAVVGGTSFQAGKATVEVTYPRWGTVIVAAADAVSPVANGQSEPITFYPEAIDLKITPPPAPRDFFYIGETIEMQVAPLANGAAAIPNYQGTIELAASPTLGLPTRYTFTAGDNGVHTFQSSTDTSGTYQVSVQDAPAAVTSPTLSVTVKQAFLKVLSTVAPVGGATEVAILLVDEKGKLIESESATSLNVKLVEENPNNSVSSSASTQPIRVIQGRARVLIADTEAETVTVIPSSPFNLKAQPGTVSFSRVATKGIGVLLWREVTEPQP